MVFCVFPLFHSLENPNRRPKTRADQAHNWRCEWIDWMILCFSFGFWFYRFLSLFFAQIEFGFRFRLPTKQIKAFALTCVCVCVRVPRLIVQSAPNKYFNLCSLVSQEWKKNAELTFGIVRFSFMCATIDFERVMKEKYWLRNWMCFVCFCNWLRVLFLVRKRKIEKMKNEKNSNRFRATERTQSPIEQTEVYLHFAVFLFLAKNRRPNERKIEIRPFGKRILKEWAKMFLPFVHCFRVCTRPKQKVFVFLFIFVFFSWCRRIWRKTRTHAFDSH